MIQARSLLALTVVGLAVAAGVLLVLQSAPKTRSATPLAATPAHELLRSDALPGDASSDEGGDISRAVRTEAATSSNEVARELPPGGVSGRVTSSSTRRGIANARVRLTFERSDELREVVELTTDVDGHYQAVIEQLAAWSAIERDTTRVLASIAAAGYVPGQSWSYAESDGNRVRNLDVVLDEGVAVHGRVVDEERRPVAFAIVEAVRYANAIDDGVIAVDRGGPTETRCDAHGEFACGFPALGATRTWALSATSPSLGCGRVVVQVSSESMPLDAGEIVLHELGVLAGRLTAADGKSLPGVDLDIAIARAPQAKELQLDVQEFLASDRAGREAILEHLQSGSGAKPLPDFTGRDRARAHTDERGRFFVAGLQPGTYTIRVAYGGAGDAHDDAALADSGGNTAFQAGSRALSLIAPGAWIHARVVDEAGAGVPGIELEYAQLAALDSKDESNAKWSTVTLDHGETSHRFEAASRVVLRAKILDRTTGERLLEAPQIGVVDVVLALRPELAPGRMRVKIRLPDGDECREYAITLRSPASHLPCATYREFETDQDGWSPQLPGGTYDLRIEVRERRDYFEQRLLPIRADPVTIGPDSAPDLAVSAQLGGHLELTLRTPAGEPPTVDGWFTQWPRAHVKVTDSAGRTILLGSRRRIGAEVDFKGLLPNRRLAVEPLLAPGAYQLHVESTHYVGAEVSVMVVAGETTKLVLDLIPTTK